MGRPFTADPFPVAHQYDDLVFQSDAALNVTVHLRKKHVPRKRKDTYNIAIGGGITSAGGKNISVYNVATKFPFFITFIPSFCATCDGTSKVTYSFYLGYDWTDEVFSDSDFLLAFKNTFQEGTQLRMYVKLLIYDFFHI